LLNRAAVFERFGLYEFAVKAALEAVAATEMPLADESVQRSVDEIRWQALSAAANLQRQRARYEEAEQILQAGLELSIKLFGESANGTSMACNQLGMVHKYAAQFEKGKPLFQRDCKEKGTTRAGPAFKPSFSVVQVDNVFHNL